MEIMLSTKTFFKNDFLSMSYADFKKQYMKSGYISPQMLLNIFQDNISWLYRSTAKKLINSHKNDILFDMQYNIEKNFDGAQLTRKKQYDMINKKGAKNKRLDSNELDAVVKFRYQGEVIDKMRAQKKFAPIHISDKELNNLKMEQVINMILDELLSSDSYSDGKLHLFA